MKRQPSAVFALALTLAIFFLPGRITLAIQAREPGQDAYEPDDPGSGEPAWIGYGETQERNFCPDGDVDRARLYVKAGHWYEVQTLDLGSLVDTVLRVEVTGMVYEDDDGGPEPLSSRVVFQAAETGEALLTITNTQGVYGEGQSYRLYAGETAPTPTPSSTPTTTPTGTPTNTPTATPTPTNTPRPTSSPVPTATPANPIINFAVSPETLATPGDCATLRWAVDRATEVFLILPSGTQEGVAGSGERQVCPEKTSEYQLKVNAQAGNQVVRVVLNVPLPTPTPTTAPTSPPDGGSAPDPKAKGTLHVVLFVDNNQNDTWDPGEGIEGASIRLVSQADPNTAWAAQTDTEGQVHFARVPGGSYSILIPPAFAPLSTGTNHAQAITFRGEETTVGLAFPALRLPSRIP